MARIMKDSGIEWIGDIPREWKLVQLKQYCHVNNGKEIGVELTKDDSEAIEVFGSGGVFKYTDKPLYDGEAVLFGRKGTLGKPIYVNQKFWTVDTMYYLTFKDRLYPKFNYYQLVAFEWKPYITQTALPSVVATQIVSCKFAFPQYEEQKKIALYLDDKIGEVDTIIEKTRASIEEYKKYKNAVVAEVVTKGLDKTVAMKESDIEWVGKIPNHWEVHILSQIFMQLKNKNSDLSETNLLSLSYGKIKRKDINSSDGLLPESFDGYNVIDKNDIVLRLTDLQNDHKSLRVGHVKERGIITSAYVTLRCKEEIATDYYYYFLHTFDIFKGFYGMGAGVRQGLNYEGIRSMKILSPDIKEQQEIADYLDKKCGEIDSLIAKKEAFVEEMEAYKKSLIYEYVTGKKEVL